MKPEFRHERKYYLSAQTAAVIKSRVASVLPRDKHNNGSYWVHNVYFDDIWRTAYSAKLRGALVRDKYRIRYYNNDLSFIRLENKHKEGELAYKISMQLNMAQYETLCAGGLPSGLGTLESDFTRLYTVNGLRPVVAFCYHREAFSFPAGDVRITFDSQMPLGSSHGIMELKFTHFLPTFVRDLITGMPLIVSENSKYNKTYEWNLLTNGFSPLKYREGCIL